MSLILTAIKKSFDKKIIFDNFSYEFSDTGIYAIVGESGIGKTTLLRMIAGLDNRYKGNIEGGGFENVSFAFQEYRLFPNLTALENVVFALSDKRDERILLESKQMLSFLGFSDEDTNLYPSELSGGMKQRVSLARAFMKKSKIILLDEPTKELDDKLREKIYELILKESESKLIIIVSHFLDDVKRLNATLISLNK
jgi:NitT/TauT family transport system ATP-binding protein